MGVVRHRYRVGDWVYLDPRAGMDWEEEEALLGRGYRILERCISKNNLPYYQLRGIYSSYGEEVLTTTCKCKGGTKPSARSYCKKCHLPTVKYLKSQRYLSSPWMGDNWKDK